MFGLDMKRKAIAAQQSALGKKQAAQVAGVALEELRLSRVIGTGGWIHEQLRQAENDLDLLRYRVSREIGDLSRDELDEMVNKAAASAARAAVLRSLADLLPAAQQSVRTALRQAEMARDGKD